MINIIGELVAKLLAVSTCVLAQEVVVDAEDAWPATILLSLKWLMLEKIPNRIPVVLKLMTTQKAM
tara:strand:- start:543 stop:740 length:198 start_codon:yes stop_codon:yes gene_type:complete